MVPVAPPVIIKGVPSVILTLMHRHLYPDERVACPHLRWDPSSRNPLEYGTHLTLGQNPEPLKIQCLYPV